MFTSLTHLQTVLEYATRLSRKPMLERLGGAARSGASKPKTSSQEGRVLLALRPKHPSPAASTSSLNPTFQPSPCLTRCLRPGASRPVGKSYTFLNYGEQNTSPAAKAGPWCGRLATPLDLSTAAPKAPLLGRQHVALPRSQLREIRGPGTHSAIAVPLRHRPRDRRQIHTSMGPSERNPADGPLVGLGLMAFTGGKAAATTTPAKVFQILLFLSMITSTIAPDPMLNHMVPLVQSWVPQSD